MKINSWNQVTINSTMITLEAAKLSRRWTGNREEKHCWGQLYSFEAIILSTQYIIIIHPSRLEMDFLTLWPPNIYFLVTTRQNSWIWLAISSTGNLPCQSNRTVSWHGPFFIYFKYFWLLRSYWSVHSRK